ncbi:hypothetical protein J3R83DRAFT_5469 [Lanmaoa asiatica]|nr:hypothetical protein J3R83DRAFT_5469 [Lanmaoa asiatica]
MTASPQEQAEMMGSAPARHSPRFFPAFCPSAGSSLVPMPPTKNDILEIVVLKVAKDPALLGLFSEALLPSPRAKFAAELEKLLSENGSKSVRSDPFSDFVDAAVTLRNTQPDHPACGLLFSTLRGFQTARSYASSKRTMLARKLGFTWTAERREQFVQHLPLIELAKLPIPYPPGGAWWYETAGVREKWWSRLVLENQPDERLRRHNFCEVDKTQLQHTVSPDQNILIRDAQTQEVVLVVLRNFCNDLSVLEWANSKVAEIAGYKKSVRLEDPGKLALVGYSAGSRSAPKFDWVLNPSPLNDKLRKFCEMVRGDGYRWAWSDTCCIDESTSALLNRSLVSMYQWYEESAATLTFLVDVTLRTAYG